MINDEPKSRQTRQSESRATASWSHAQQSTTPTHVLHVYLTQLSRFSAGADEHLDAVAGHRHQTDAALLILLQTEIAAHRAEAAACVSVNQRHRSPLHRPTLPAGDLDLWACLVVPIVRTCSLALAR